MIANRHVKHVGLLIVLVAALAACLTAAERISVSQSVDRFTIPYEDSLHFDVALQWRGPQSAYLFTSPLSPTFDGLKVQSFTSSISSTGSGDAEITTKRFRYTLVPTASGTGTIYPVTVSYVTWPDSIPGELVTEAMTVRIAQPVPPSEDGGSAVVWLVAIFVIAAGTAGVVLAVRRRGQRPVVIEKTPAEQFLETLGAVKREAAGDFKKFQTGLYDSLVAFVKARYGLSPDRLSDDEVEQALEATDLDSDRKTQLGNWLIEARRDKFRPAGGGPADTVRLETEVRQFFERL